jgi:hypothetical protein
MTQQTFPEARPEAPPFIAGSKTSNRASEKKAAGRLHAAAATCKGALPPAGCAHSTPLVDRIEPEAGFLQRRLEQFVRARRGGRAACFWCGHGTWWRSLAFPDVVRCGRCSPPAPGVAVQWLTEGGGISGEMPGPGEESGPAIAGPRETAAGQPSTRCSTARSTRCSTARASRCSTARSTGPRQNGLASEDVTAAEARKARDEVPLLTNGHLLVSDVKE